MTQATTPKTTHITMTETKGFRKDERRVRRFSDRGSRGGKVEDVLAQEIRQK